MGEVVGAIVDAKRRSDISRVLRLRPFTNRSKLLELGDRRGALGLATPSAASGGGRKEAALVKDPTFDFYVNTIERLVARDVFRKDASTLVLAAAANDRDAIDALGFTNVTFSNVDPRLSAADFAPHAMRSDDAQQLALEDEAFDQVIIANALHHCRSPHRALLEMYRVAGRAALAFENRDSLLMRIASRFSFAQEFEHEAVYFNEMKFGGVDNTDIPNHIYRWTEREVEKTINSFRPEFKPRFHYFYGLRTPAARLKKGGSFLHWVSARTAFLGVRMLTVAVPSQSNLFAFCIEKSNDIWPWIRVVEGKYRFNEEWARKRFG